ncbi:CBS domain-containing protein [Neptuniibacter sp. CAU 1671]|uniref:CBS domain-containing protein n=1 Tax=Neptuniibacter sp. CAU 1671 TaxID=3032593 RepID=UPI0023DAAD8A|nr:CBS domain-containing protein [Neptuniibacter sp. CAU 1671]MDF2182294.1 CBS domain-containing protein [Neptuniibacter sp. CAU 1671]
MRTLQQYTAGEIMTRELLTASEHWSIQTLIDFFNRHKISGAPVLSAQREFVGVVSLSDILTFDGVPRHSMEENPMTQYYCNMAEGATPDELGFKDVNQHQSHLVSEIMTQALITAPADTSVPALSALMHNKGIHRVFITEDDQICGAVSTLDILRLVADL